MDGDHHIDKTQRIQRNVIREVFKACEQNGVFLEGTLLKPSMTVSGADCSDQVDYKLVAQKTIQTLLSCVPPKCQYKFLIWWFK